MNVDEAAATNPESARQSAICASTSAAAICARSITIEPTPPNFVQALTAAGFLSVLIPET